VAISPKDPKYAEPLSCVGSGLAVLISGKLLSTGSTVGLTALSCICSGWAYALPDAVAPMLMTAAPVEAKADARMRFTFISFELVTNWSAAGGSVPVCPAPHGKEPARKSKHA
jgi:hypothetical protein